MSENHMESGWTVEKGAIYHFEHVDKEWAENLLEEHVNLLYAIEVLHYPLPEIERPAHKNTFLVWGYVDALLKAVQIQGAPYPDEVLEIRLASPAEIKRWLVLFDHYGEVLHPPALSDEQVDKLVGKEK